MTVVSVLAFIACGQEQKAPDVAEATPDQVTRVEPPCWWAGMKTDLQLLVQGPSISDYDVRIFGDAEVTGVHKAESPNYLFVDVKVGGPGACSIVFVKDGEYAFKVPYQIGERREGSAERKGFSSADMVYLIMPDRFANGDPSNDNTPDTADKVDREKLAGRHGGDIKGIMDHLDYIADLGATAIWNTPLLEDNEPRESYHGYACSNYYRIDPRFGDNEMYCELVRQSHARGIKMIMDIVTNHCGSAHWWMKDLPFQDWVHQWPEYTHSNCNFAMQNDPNSATIDQINMQSGWFDTSMPDMNLDNPYLLQYFKQWAVWWIEYADLDGLRVDTYPYNEKVPMSQWCAAVRKEYPNINIVGEVWTSNIAQLAGANTITFDQPLTLTSNNAQDITFGATTYYLASFDASMPDLNYGPYTSCEESGAFKSTVEAATKWMNLGVDGFRLDAVLWIYQAQIKANQRFLDQWYQAVNTAYKAIPGHDDDIFMVGEAWEGHGIEKQYYKGLISNFEFEYFGALTNAVNKGSGGSYVSAVSGYIQDHKSQRSDAITSIFMTNHDQDRAAESFGKDVAKEKQAAAMLLSSEGKPFIYQGEELGYWGKTEKGDASRRQPMAWDKNLSDLCKFGLSDNHKSDLTDYDMVTASISVEAQDSDKNSLLNVYKAWNRVRNTYPAMAEGTMTASSLNGGAIASWYMTSSDGKKMLVIHNCGNAEKRLGVADSISKPVVVLGTVKAERNTLIMPGHSSIVFDLQ